MIDLVPWLRAQLDEDERIARAAAHGGAGEWTTEDGYPVSVVGLPREANTFDRVVAFDEGSPSEEQAAHIAAHDPARVLREIDAKRQILAAYAELVERVQELTALVGRLRAMRQDVLMVEMDQESAIHKRDALHGVLRLLALPYADRPGYREEWRP